MRQISKYAKLVNLYALIMDSDAKNKEAYLKELERLTDRAEENFPDSFEIQRVRGIIAFAQEDYESSAQRFRLALEKKPGDFAVALGLAQALASADKGEEAEKFASSFVQQHKNAIGLYDFLYRRLYIGGRKAEALAVLEAKAKNNPDNLVAPLQIALSRPITRGYSFAWPPTARES